MRRLSLLIGFGLAFSACSNDFAPYSQLDRLRILAVRSEPATPLPGEVATLSALTFVPTGESLSYHWTWCPVTASASQDYACPLDQATANLVFAGTVDPGIAAELPSLDLGQAATASLNNPFSISGLSALCAAGLDSQGFSQGLDCEGGFPVTVVLDVSTATVSLRAGFVLRLPYETPPLINHNPSPAGLSLAEISLSDTPIPIVVSPKQTIDLQAQIPADAAELRPIPASEGPPGQRLERLTASWFADAGRIDKPRTAFIDGVAPLDQTSQNRWTAPSATEWPANNLVQFLLVLRDDRGGAGWLVRQVQLEQPP
ncbi:MAG TPA: hypothetical protein VJ860_05800 [Polyangia bacterium]|nr:hypothetical protein [Polyangia bacterium]